MATIDKTQTLNQYIEEQTYHIAHLHKKALDILGVCQGTWIKRRKTGNFDVDQINLLSKELFKIRPTVLFQLCCNSREQFHVKTKKGS